MTGVWEEAETVLVPSLLSSVLAFYCLRESWERNSCSSPRHRDFKEMTTVTRGRRTRENGF